MLLRPERHRQAMLMDDKSNTKNRELRAFLALAVVLAPVLAVIVVTGYGFLVWMAQLVAGPPGPRF